MNTFSRLANMTLGGESAEALRASLAQLFRRFRADEIPIRNHPLGFLDLPLSNGSTEVARKLEQRATIHIWHPAISRPEDHELVCHSHGWKLTSTVLVGSIGNQLFEVEDGRGGRFRYQISYEGDSSISKRTPGECIATSLAGPHYYAADSTYTIPGTAFHATALRSEALVVTAMISDNSVPQAATAVYPDNTPSILKYGRTRLGLRETERVIADIAREL